MNKTIKQVAIFLGAGASAADGAPMQSQLFKQYFELVKAQPEHYKSIFEDKVADFFNKMFDIDCKNTDLNDVNFPTFEEALGILDLADIRNESFRDFPNINLDHDSGKIKYLRLYLVFLLAEVLNNKLQNSNNIHRKLVNNLLRSGYLKRTCFVTTNYDILCDNALLEFSNGASINYGIDFRNYFENNINPPELKSPVLFKLHGSLNWLYCPTCNTVKQTPFEKGVYNLIVDPNQSYCHRCHSFYSPIIIPPTFYKDLSNIYLSTVWNKTELALTYVNHIIFCGYSFPDADIHIKYLIKRIQKNRKHKNIKFTIINNHIDKSDDTKIEERNRFVRFLGENVNYTELSFEDFANDPTQILESNPSLAQV